ncbi:MAG: C39 family peptidase [Clostridia bacterium]|jgi:hypothetical protein|nr:C39 family peptidase [Clostridia bacterium]MCI2014198.1 C39 family peptidase [Clostridia bacterium]
MKEVFKKIFNMIFMVTLISFIVFLYLFANNITPPDIDYFVKNTKESSQKIAVVVKQKIDSEIASLKKPDKTIAKVAEAKETPDKTDNSENEDNVVLKSDTSQIVYYSQTDNRWKNAIYGADNTIGVYGCGPTVLAMVLSSLTDKTVTPVDAAKWAYDNGHFSYNNGSYHSIIPKGAEKHGLDCKSLEKPSKQDIIDNVSKGNIIVVLMNKGTFTTDGHFIILRGITKDSKVLIADPKSIENSKTPWDIDIILKEAKYSANYGGPFWSISNPKA